ncbi:MAG: hypothetical protein ACFFDN_07175 [Candidatus Hodarchaeota archaeon]
MFQINIQKDHNEVWDNLGLIIPFLKPWLKQQRWSGLSNVDKFDLEIAGNLSFKEESALKIFGYFLSINAINTITSFFLPLIFYLDKKKIGSLPEIVINTNSSEFYISQAECYRDFINLLIENFQKQKTQELKKGKYFKFDLENEQLLENFELVNSEVFKKGETTNFLTKIKGKKSNLFLKSYRKISTSREPLLIRELFKLNYENIPQPIGFAKLANGEESVCFNLQEFITFENDLGYYFWVNLKHRLEYPSPEHQVAFINDANLNLNLLGLVDLVINFHQKSSTSKNHQFEKQNFSNDDVQSFKDSQKKIMDEILKHRDKNLQIFKNLPKNFNQIRKELQTLENFIGFNKITVHQDLHLAQILVKSDKEGKKKLYITDLEGDPNRPIEEIWERDLIFRDLASLITAFHYIEVNSVLHITTLTKEDLKLVESFADAKNQFQKKIGALSTTMSEAKLWTDYLIRNLMKSYYDKYLTIFDNGKNIDFNTFQKGCEIYKFDRLIREIYYELKYRKDNYVVPLIILNNSFDSLFKV